MFHVEINGRRYSWFSRFIATDMAKRHGVVAVNEQGEVVQ